MSPANLDSALKSCSKLVQSGCLSKGLCTLERFVNNETQTLVSNNQQEILQLHPQDSWDIRNEAPCLVPDEEFIIDPDLFLKCIATLPNKSSTSFSAWSFEIIKSLALSSQEFFDKLLTLFSKILNGHLFQSRDFWTSSRLICIRKANGKLRPIAIGNVWYRLASRIGAATLKTTFKDILSPIQLGVGVAGGCEIIAQTCSFFCSNPDNYANNYILKSMDLSNAFNTISRKAIYEAINDFTPSLRRYFLWSYGFPSILFDSNQQIFCHSSAGVRQGDPLGPAFFALGIHKYLLQIRELYPNIALLAYLDDIVFMGLEAEVHSAYDHLRNLLSGINLICDPSKSVTYPPRNSSSTSPSGITILGCPMGENSFVSDYVTSSFSSFSVILNTLLELDAKYAFPLVKYCINCRPSFLIRICSPQLTDSASLTFDSAIDHFLLKKFSIAASSWGQVRCNIRHLPLQTRGFRDPLSEPYQNCSIQCFI